ncbi:MULTISPECIES: SbmA/BacA-like family transporter [unclassified Beijerinckia]|uniref:ABC transporter ATP-binding protein/permease n=1 Tax=unclassified Beijerinckia TaxID=2638183 RepID=UPI00089C29D2|nr:MULTISPECIES: SbmA/BacA-like family transporter [unclassified Beijerinckia]MDH7796106.1 putative ATP-binding cassette transporter [Beijerinckia sp. GAS462]SEC30593.1 putative ATP-binding cassette transporter [Beijerinckia sp. 28-YEA-48]
MSDPASAGPSTPAPGFDRATALRFNRFAGGFWRGAAARTAWTWTIALALFLVLKLGVDVATNRWHRWFFDALEHRDGTSAMLAVVAFMGLIGCVAAIGVGIVITRETLQVRWREWCTKRLLDRWMRRQRFYRLSTGTRMPNPEYRISDDVRMATEPLTDFAIGLFTATLAAAAFFSILWSVGGALNVTLWGENYRIPAFMVIGALLYGVTVSTLIPIVGRKLAGVAAAKNEAEARFRFEMIRLRENAEGVIMAGGETAARARLDTTYSGLVRQWLQLVRQHGNITWVMNANSALIPVVPLLLAAPKYLSGELSLGEVMQLASAFAQVQVAIAWLVDNYRAIAEWFASAHRVVELADAFDDQDRVTANGMPLVSRGVSGDGALHLASLRLTDRNGRVVIEQAEAVIPPSSRIMLSGEAGSGKSVLLRAIAGLWPWGAGAILLPENARVQFLPATPFLPAGPLREALTYPALTNDISPEALDAVLTNCGILYLRPRLDESTRWDQALSASERQRIAFARTILQQPDIIILDDTLSVFDEAGQIEIIDALIDSCPNTTIINTGGHGGVSSRFERHLFIGNSGGGMMLREAAAETPVLSIVTDSARQR